VNRDKAIDGLLVAAAIALVGTALYLVRARKLGEWPFGKSRD
jgi:uncharacterized membrane protein